MTRACNNLLTQFLRNKNLPGKKLIEPYQVLVYQLLCCQTIPYELLMQQAFMFRPSTSDKHRQDMLQWPVQLRSGLLFDGFDRMCPLLSYDRKVTRLPLNGNDFAFMMKRVRWVTFWLALKWDYAGGLQSAFYNQVFQIYCRSPIALYNTLLLLGLQMVLLPEKNSYSAQENVEMVHGRIDKDDMLRDL